jgi:predicted metal-dependent hydrolase
VSGTLLRRVGEQLGLFDEAPASAEPGSKLREVVLGAQRVPYQLQRAQRRSIGFVVGPEGLSVRAPRWVGVGEIESALRQRGDWILRQWQLQQQRLRQQELLRIRWGEGAELPYLGEPLRVQRGELHGWQPASDGLPARLSLRLPQDALESQWRDATQAWLQTRARELFQARLMHYAALLQVETPKLRLSSAKGRWGSASSGGTVSLNWRLMHFSPALIDYVVAHEVAHLREMNHGPRFWALVGELLPGFEQTREQLKRVELPGF